MNRSFLFIAYSFFAGILLILDIWTKQLALVWCPHDYVLNPFITCSLTINRGISWGLFSTDAQLPFVIISLVLVAIVVWLIWHTWQRWLLKKMILGEVLVVTGAIGNIIDRFVYDGVVDFMLLHYGDYAFPALFNLADVYITIGVFLMFCGMLYE